MCLRDLSWMYSILILRLPCRAGLGVSSSPSDPDISSSSSWPVCIEICGGMPVGTGGTTDPGGAARAQASVRAVCAPRRHSQAAAPCMTPACSCAAMLASSGGAPARWPMGGSWCGCCGAVWAPRAGGFIMRVRRAAASAMRCGGVSGAAWSAGAAGKDRGGRVRPAPASSTLRRWFICGLTSVGVGWRK